MKKILFLASLALLTAGSGLAVAQPAPPPPPGSAYAPPPPPGPDRRGPPRADMRGPAGGLARLADGAPMPPPPSPGAHFRIERGGNVVDVKCADDQPMQACAVIARQLLSDGRQL